jgi:hypothetical protein
VNCIVIFMVCGRIVTGNRFARRDIGAQLRPDRAGLPRSREAKRAPRFM